MTNAGDHRQDVALIVGGGPGISASCARLFASEGMQVAVAARGPDKPVLVELEKEHGVRRYACDSRHPDPYRSALDYRA
jgi:NAD(P)-dependent dehydrogenase (short-subunit alcohol dehydrogenase family)